MEWNRSDLKRSARAAFRRNYLSCMLAGLILLFALGSQKTGEETAVESAGSIYLRSMATGGGDAVPGGDTYAPGGSTDTPGGSSEMQTEARADAGKLVYDPASGEMVAAVPGDDAAAAVNGTGSSENGAGSSENGAGYSGDYRYNMMLLLSDPGVQMMKRYLMGPVQVIWDGITDLLGGAGPVVLLFLQYMVFSALEIGGCRFFVRNSGDKNTGLKELIFAFEERGYFSMMMTMLIRNLLITLWSMLFLVPGIVKLYQYRMVPYLLAEDPDMGVREALERSREYMDGQKWNAFLLDLSMIPWHIASALSFGLSGIFYSQPYINAVNAELYLVLREKETGSAETVIQAE